MVVIGQTRGTTLFAGETESTNVPEGSARVFVTALGPGSVSGAGIFVIGSQVTVVATPDAGKYFRGWKKNGSEIIVSMDASYTFELTGTTDLVATFADSEAPASYNIQVVNANPQYGTISPEGVQVVEAGGSIRLTATPNEGDYDFDGWMVNGKVVSTASPFDYQPSGNGTITARFSKSGVDEG